MVNRQNIMEERQGVEAEALFSNTPVSALAVKKMNAPRGQMHKVSGVSSAQQVMLGRLDSCDLGNGLAMHCCDAMASVDANSSAELQPCLSVNILLAGELTFRVGQHKYHLVSDASKVTCCALTLNRPEILTRYLVKGQWTQKVNVSMSRQWLWNRAKNSHQRGQLDTLLGNSADVHQWQANDEVIASARRLLFFPQQRNLAQELAFEQEVLALSNLCVAHLLAKTENTSAQTIQASEYLPSSLKALVDDCADKQMSLADIAEKANISVSTLQRRFKRSLQMTVSQYIRLRRLDRARATLLTQGLSIGEAAYIAGYDHSSNFISAFKQQYGVTPAEIVRQHGGSTKFG